MGSTFHLPLDQGYYLLEIRDATYGVTNFLWSFDLIAQAPKVSSGSRHLDIWFLAALKL